VKTNGSVYKSAAPSVKVLFALQVLYTIVAFWSQPGAKVCDSESMQL